MIKTIIIDDEQAAIEIVATLSQRFSKEIQICGTANSIKKGIELIQIHNPDLVFLDIELPEGLGFDVLRAFPKARFHTVFVTAFEGYAIEAIKHQAFDYILKPVDLMEFKDMLSLVTEKIKGSSNNSTEIQSFLKTGVTKKIGIPDSFGVTYLESNNIIRVQADGPYSEVHVTVGKKHVVSRILKHFETTLTPLGFIRVHRAHLVNLEHITSFSRSDGGFLLLSNNDKIPIARKEKEVIYELLNQRFLSI